ncbi:MAG TPA: hypothetical protein VJJ48_01845 [Candidatus Paceibacterota bacterium]
MKNEIRIIIGAAILLIIFAFLSTRVPRERNNIPDSNGSWACTADAFICPDGTGVGRIPPYCHFAPCPGM